MLKTSRGQSSSGPDPGPGPSPLVVFRVGGHPLAAKVGDIGGVWPWPGAIPVPSGTARVGSLVRHGEEVFAVFDLADRLNVSVKGGRPLCLIVKHCDGPLAICIDEDIPSLQTVDGALIGTGTEQSDILGTCQVGAEAVPIYSLATLKGSRN